MRGGLLIVWLLVLSSVASAAATARAAAVTLDQARPTRNLRFGLSGLQLTRDPATRLSANLYLRDFAGPRRRYPTSNIRVIVDDGFVREGEERIAAALADRRAEQRASRARGAWAPVMVSTFVDNADVMNAAGGVDVCDPPIAGQDNPTFNPRRCGAVTIQIETSSLTTLMSRFPQVKLWTAQNEPENQGKPTFWQTGGAVLAARMYVLADRVAMALGHGQVVMAGEFWQYPSVYIDHYFSSLVRRLHHRRLPMPVAEAIHPYETVECDDGHSFWLYLQQLRRHGLFAPARRGYGVIATESGGVWPGPWYGCPNALAVASVRGTAPDHITPAQITTVAAAELRSAEAFMHLGSVDARMPMIEDAYAPAPPRGCVWDTSVITDTGPMIAYYVYTHRPVPGWMLAPTTPWQLQAAITTEVPPIFSPRCDGTLSPGAATG